MARTQPLSSLSLEELLLLNEEIAAISCAGIPLERGLAALGDTTPGQLGAVARHLAAEAGQGKPLAELLSEQSAVPPVYRAVVLAGLRAGRLPAALEAVASSLRRLVETRRGIMFAAWYPLLVLILACVALSLFCVFLAPTLASSFTSMGLTSGRFFAGLSWLGESAMWWGTLVPALVLGVAFVWWHQSRHAGLVAAPRASLLFGWLPWAGRTACYGRLAAFAEVLALLVEHETPLDEALRLAADASGDESLRAAAGRVAVAIARGEAAGVALQREAGLPIMLRWWLAAALRRPETIGALRHAAESYRRRADDQAELVRLLAPTILTLLIGGTATVFYAMMVFVPYISLLRSLG